MKAAVLVLCFLAVALADPKILYTRTHENIPSDWTLKGPADEDHKLDFIIALKQENLDKLEEIFWDVSNPDSENYRNFMTIEEITALVSPSIKVQKKVMRWLIDGGAEDLENRGDNIKGTIAVSHASELFHTSFKVYEHVSGRQIVKNFGSYAIPHKMSEHVEMVAGLSEFPQAKFNMIKTPKQQLESPDVLVSISPQSVQTIYKLGSASVTKNSSAGVIEFEDQYFSPTDLQNFATQFGVRIPALTANHIIGTNDPSNPQIEATLDIQYVLGVGLGAQGWFWIEDDNVWLYGFATHMFATPSVPLVNSISYGWNEEAQCQDGIGGAECQKYGWDNTVYVQRINTEFQKIGIRGITLICASGDSGANGRTDPYCSENHLNPVFPGASPYITSVGATQISAASGQANLPNPPPGCSGQNCASGGTEECVSYAQANFASGGGFSDIAAAPPHQKAAIAAYFASGVQLPPASYYNNAGRGFPDVAAFGSNVLILTGGQIEGVGGTSCSSPIIAGIVSILNDVVIAKSGKPLGHIAPLFYKMAADAPSTFTDITKGDNICTEAGCSSACKGFYAAKGWDPVSGLGSPVYPEMLKYVQAHVLKENQ